MNVIFKAPNRNAPKSKLAEAELHFTSAEGDLLDGLVLTGFVVWKRRDGSGLVLQVPGREYEKDGERKSFDFLRYAARDDRPRLDNLKSIILEEYERWSQEQGGSAQHDAGPARW